MSLSESEQNDKTLLYNTLFTNIKVHRDFLIEKNTRDITLFISMKPPTRCSDGKRRPYLMDYVDFLFGDPQLEDLIESENVKTPDFTRSIHPFDWGFEIKFKLET